MQEDRHKRRYCSEGGFPRGNLNADNWLAGISDSSDYDIVEVSFKNTRVGFYTNPERLPLEIGDIVAVEGNPGHDIGRVSMTGRLVAMQMRKNGVKEDSELKRVFRLATQADLEKFEEARNREHDTMIRSRKIAEDLELNMKIGDVEYQGDGGKAIFYYIADERVDFRKLIRILADTFKIRVEMRQIGARQEAGRIGGIGPCGRPLCCASWMTHFVSVGTGAARTQDLSMNPQKLAGQCAKLKCCLNFEIDAYSEANKQLPPRDTSLLTQDAEYFYFKPDILARKITYSTDKKIPVNLVTIDTDRAFEVIEMNKRGEKPEQLERESEQDEKPQDEYVDLVEQESLTRFDKSKKKKRKGSDQRQGKGGDSGKNRKQNGKQGDKQAGDKQAGDKQAGEQPRKQAGEQPDKQGGEQPRKQGAEQPRRRPNRHRNQKKNQGN